MLITVENPPETFKEAPPAESIVDANGTYQRWSITEEWNDEQLAAVGIYRVPEAIVPKGRTVQSYTIQRIAGVVQQVLVLGNILTDLTAYAAEARWRTETGGVVHSGGTRLRTDRTTQAMLSNCYAYLTLHPSQPTEILWKGSAGFLTLTKQQVIDMHFETLAWVENCFNTERLMQTQIQSSRITTAEAIDAAFAAL